MHAKGRRTDIQEFLVLSKKASTAAEASEANIRVHAEVPKLISKFGATVEGKGDEGAWVSDLETHKALELLSEACLLYTSPSPRDRTRSRMPSSA